MKPAKKSKAKRRSTRPLKLTDALQFVEVLAACQNAINAREAADMEAEELKGRLSRLARRILGGSPDDDAIVITQAGELALELVGRADAEGVQACRASL